MPPLSCSHVLTRLLLVAILNGCGQAPPPGEKESAQVAAEPVVPVEVVDQWKIPNGGSVRVLVISPNNRNETDMRRLGDQIRKEAATDRNAGAEIYDDKRAASLRADALADKLSKQDMLFHDKHKVGAYTKNGNTGFHRLVLMLDGATGTFVNVDYR